MSTTIDEYELMSSTGWLHEAWQRLTSGVPLLWLLGVTFLAGVNYQKLTQTSSYIEILLSDRIETTKQLSQIQADLKWIKENVNEGMVTSQSMDQK